MQIITPTIHDIAARLDAVLCTVIISFLFIQASHCQPLAFDLLGQQEEVEIPFELENGFIIVEIKLSNTLPLRFIFDTGAENTILFHKVYADLLNFTYDKKIKISGADLIREVYANVTRNIQITIGKKISVNRDILVLEEEVLEVHSMMGSSIDGIIGGSFFRGMVVNIDYDEEKIRFINPMKFKPKKGFTEIPVEIISNKPYLDATIFTTAESSVSSKLLIDSGSAIPLLLHSNTDTTFTLPPQLMIGSLGRGIGGFILGFKGKIHKLDFGRFTFGNVITAFQDIDTTLIDKRKLVRNGLLGNEMLTRFEVTIDYFKARLYLKPNRNYNKTFKYDRSGIIVFALGKSFDQFIINAIIDGSPAHEADIRQGDKIVKIGCWKAKFWSLGKLNGLLSTSKRKKVKLVIERNGEKMKKIFWLEDYFNVDRQEISQ